jgi:MFS transporter, MHS family, citrate/tricarballylate:H+ symporter
MGAISDRIDWRRVLMAFTVLTILTAYPAIRWLANGPTFEKMLTVLLWLSRASEPQASP